MQGYTKFGLENFTARYNLENSGVENGQ